MANAADSGATDLGRRIAEHRDRASLTVDETAERAGMSADYVAYLESSSAPPNPTQATLTRLAAALGTTPGSLSGSGLAAPPGQHAPARKAVLENLSAAECKAHIAAGGVGRFLFNQASRGPVAIPVNYRMDGDDVVFRTASGGSILEAMDQERVSFDVDHLDDALAEGWSVLLTGTASIITDQTELAQAEALDVEPWAGGDRPVYVRLTVSQLSGRRIRVSS